MSNLQEIIKTAAKLAERHVSPAAQTNVAEQSGKAAGATDGDKIEDRRFTLREALCILKCAELVGSDERAIKHACDLLAGLSR